MANTRTTVTLSHATRRPAPVALPGTGTRGAMPVWSKIWASPSHTHSAFPPGIAATYRMFECGNAATRQWTLTSPPPIVATAPPKSTCMTPSLQSSSR